MDNSRDSVEFFVPGIPAPKGSKKAFVRGKRAVLVNANDKTKPWEASISAAAYEHWTMQGNAMLDEPVHMVLLFTMPQPTSRKKAKECDRKPDIDKLARSVLDALSGIVFVDDSRVTKLNCSKIYGTPGVKIWIAKSTKN